MSVKVRQLTELLHEFVEGQNYSMEHAGKIEVLLDDIYAGEEPYAALALALASYRPEGGDLLYDTDQIAAMMRPVLSRITREARKL